MNNEHTESVFKQPLWVGLFAFTAAVLWGWAYPLIKLGMEEFAITTEMTGAKILFAGLRFLAAGLIILSIALCTRRRLAVSAPSNWWFILLFSLLNTTFHYAFFYFGLSHS